MKKIYILTLIAIIAFLNISCEETVNPKAEFKEQYVLTCIIDVASDSLFAVITKTYDTQGLNPEANKIDPAVTGAEITITQAGSSFQLIEGDRKRTDSTRYTTRQQYYYAKHVSFVGQKEIKIFAKLPNGKILSSSTTPPDMPEIKFSREFSSGIDPTVNTYTIGDYYSVKWYPVNKNHLIYPRLSIPYYKLGGPKVKFLRKEIPLSYVKQGGKYIPNYPGATQLDTCAFEYKAIKYALENLSEGDPNTSNYVLNRVEFELLELDSPMSTYFSSTNGEMDNFSIRTEEMVYSNINGGLGIFGSYRKTTIRKKLDAYYIATTLGYQWDRTGGF